MLYYICKQLNEVNEMAENLTLEQELLARIFVHKVSITGGVLMKEYINSQAHGDVNIPMFQLEEQADKYSDSIIQKALQDGTFNQLYEQSWDKVKHTIPEYTKVI
jgi:hypothetical protein